MFLSLYWQKITNFEDHTEKLDKMFGQIERHLSSHPENQNQAGVKSKLKQILTKFSVLIQSFLLKNTIQVAICFL